MDDFKFKYFGEEEGIEESEEFTDDYERRSVRVNRDGKKILRLRINQTPPNPEQI